MSLTKEDYLKLKLERINLRNKYSIELNFKKNCDIHKRIKEISKIVTEYEIEDGLYYK